MGRKTKIWLLVAATLVLIGCVLFAGVMTMLTWDFTNLSTSKFETNHYEITEEYQNISILGNTADITFLPSDTRNSRVICYERENASHRVAVKNGTLVIEFVDERKWYEHLSVNFDSPKITVYMPQGEYGALSVTSDTGHTEVPKDFTFESVKISQSTGHVSICASVLKAMRIQTTTGNIRVENISAGTMELSVSTGHITVSNARCSGDVSIRVSTGKANLTNVSCMNLSSKGSTGDLSLKNVIAAEKFTIERRTGDVRFDTCDAAEIFVKTDTGDVKGSLLTEKRFIAQTDTGTVNVPNTTAGGICEIITDTGNIKLEIPGT